MELGYLIVKILQKHSSEIVTNPLRDADLRFFVDTALYSGILNEEQTRRIVKNLKGLSGKNVDMITSYHIQEHLEGLDIHKILI